MREYSNYKHGKMQAHNYIEYGEEIYKQYNSTYHKCISENEIVCKYCEKVVDTETETVKAKHYFKRNVCVDCDYERECEHEETRVKNYCR